MTQTQSQEMNDSFFVYEDLIKNYKTALVDNLRGFGLGKDILDLWVPNEDICKSLADLLFAAKANDARSIRLSINRSYIKENEENTIREMLTRNYPSYELFWEKERLFLEVFGLTNENNTQYTKKLVDRVTNTSVDVRRQDKAQADVPSEESQPVSIHRIYVAGLAKAPIKKDVSHFLCSNPISVSQELDGLFFELTVNPENGIILDARYKGSKSDTAANLSRILTAMMVGLPLIEVANHGMIRLENYLRQDSMRTKDVVSGILIPEKSDPAFHFFGALCRKLFISFQNVTKYQEKNSDYDDQASDLWLKSSHERRFELLSNFFQNNGFATENIEVIAIEYDVRVVIDLPHPSGELLLRIERQLRKSVDPRLEVFLAEIQDKNKLRSSRVLKIGEKS